MTTNPLTTLWTGWTDFWGEAFNIKKRPQFLSKKAQKWSKKAQKQSKTRSVRLKRDIKKLRRPSPKTIDTEWDTEPREDTEEVKEVYKKRVAPPKVFDLPESALELPQDRAERIKKRVEKKQKRVDKLRLSDLVPVSKKRKHMLFVNPGDEKLSLLHKALQLDLDPPKWSWPFQFTSDSKNVYFEGLPMAKSEDKRNAVKKMYFDPKGPSTILPITQELRSKWANISKSNVTRILKTFEVYQLNFRRRQPPKIMGRMVLKGPGIILMDMFFPSKLLGWRKSNCLTCMDAWSRFVRVYVLDNKTKKLQIKAMTMFLQEFAATGHMPLYVLADRGSDLRGAYDAMEPFRTKPGKLVMHSKTGQPVQLVESCQAQIQRRMQVFRTAGITDDPAVVLQDISDSINNQRRPERGNLTPIQLLRLTKEQRQRINEEYARKNDDIPEVRGLRPIHVGNSVRTLLWTMKEQLTNSKKGFTPKWSRDVWTVRRKVRISGNPNNFRYFLQGEPDNEGFFRHELLKISKNVDTSVLDLTNWKKATYVSEDLYSPSDDE